MTREDIERMFAYQAADAAYKYAGERCRKDRPISASKLEAFEAGAEWAQEFMIKKACEWLENNFVYFLQGAKRGIYSNQFVTVNEMVDNFKRRMEE